MIRLKLERESPGMKTATQLPPCMTGVPVIVEMLAAQRTANWKDWT